MAMLLSYSIFCKWSGVFFPQHPYVPVKIWSLFPNAFSNWTPLRLSQNLTLPKIPLDSLLKKITHFGCILGHPMPHTRQKPTEKGLRVGEWNAHPNPVKNHPHFPSCGALKKSDLLHTHRFTESERKETKGFSYHWWLKSCTTGDVKIPICDAVNTSRWCQIGHHQTAARRPTTKPSIHHDKNQATMTKTNRNNNNNKNGNCKGNYNQQQLFYLRPCLGVRASALKSGKKTKNTWISGSKGLLENLQHKKVPINYWKSHVFIPPALTCFGAQDWFNFLFPKQTKKKISKQISPHNPKKKHQSSVYWFFLLLFDGWDRLHGGGGYNMQL